MQTNIKASIIWDQMMQDLLKAIAYNLICWRSNLTFKFENVSLNKSKIVSGEFFMSFWVSYPVQLFQSDRDFLISHWSRCPLKKRHSALSNAFVGHFTFNFKFLTCKMSKRVHVNQNKALSSVSLWLTHAFVRRIIRVLQYNVQKRIFYLFVSFLTSATLHQMHKVGNVTRESADVQRNVFVINKRLDDWIAGKMSSL